MQLVPIPTTKEAVDRTAQHWLPFIPGIARRSKEAIPDLLGRIDRFDVQLALVWDGKAARALIGIQIVKRGADLVGEIIWLTGIGMRDWLHLEPQLEQYLKEHIGCKIIRPICRKGWYRLMKPHGYKVTHYVMEKPL